MIKKISFEFLPINRVCINSPFFLSMIKPTLRNTFKVVSSQFHIFTCSHFYNTQHLAELINDILGILINLGIMEILMFILVKSLILVSTIPIFEVMGVMTSVLVWTIIALANTWKETQNLARVTFLDKGSTET